MEIKDRILSQLNELGPSEEDVVNKLTELGIKGRRSSVCSCPIANYVISVGCNVICIGCETILISDEGREVLIKMPQHIGDFIKHFDLRQYPQLET
jgi:hypothetical protein